MKTGIKKAVSVLLVAIMMFSIAPLAGFVGIELPATAKAEAVTEYTSDYYTYSVLGGKASIIRVDISISGDVVIPSTLGGYPVTSIELDAFCDCTGITSVVVPDSVKNIEDFAFGYCDSLESITLGNGVTTIGIAAFSSCTSLKSITIPAKVTSIGYAAFQGCISLEKIIVDPENLAYSSDENGVLFNKDKTVLVQYPIGKKETSYKVPDGTKTIAHLAFHECDNLVSVEFPDSLAILSYNSFEDCSALEEVVFGSGIRSICESAFEYCESLAEIELPDGMTYICGSAFSGTAFEDDDSNWENDALYIGDYLIDTYYNSESVTVKDGTKLIASGAFHGAVTGIVIPDSVASLGMETFYSCSNLKEITIGSGVKNIGYDSFYDCKALEKITVSPENTVYSTDENGILFNKDKTVLIKYPAKSTNTSYTIPDGVEIISEGAFEQSTNLSTVVIPDSVTTIERNAFRNCSALENVTLSENLEIIDAYAFNHCSKIKEITIPDGVKTIDNGAFNYCSALATVSIPDSVEFIGAYAFEQTALYKNSSNWEDDSLYISNHLIKVNNSVEGTYSIKEGTKSIDGLAFNNCDGITDVIIPDSVTGIGEKVFWDCDGLTSIVIPEGVRKIGDEAFYGCENLADVTLPDSLNSIGVCVFEDTAIYDNESNRVDGVLYIGNHLIKADVLISGEYSIKEGTKVIADEAFGGCTKLTSIEFPASVTDIGTYSLVACRSLEKFIVSPENQDFSTDEYGVLFSKDKTVLYCYPISRTESCYEIPDGVEEICTGAFYLCGNITDFIIPDSLRIIGEMVFYAYEHFTNIHYAGSVEDWSAIRVGDENYGLYGAVFEYNYNPCKHSQELTILTPATCTEDGIKEIKCAVCGEVFSIEVIPSSGHTESEWIVVLEPTTKTEGKQIKKCTVCSEPLGEETIPMLPVTGPVKDDGVILTPSTTEIAFLDSIILHVDTSKIPEGGHVEWTASNGNFEMKVPKKALTCQITSVKNGDTVITATIYDADGNAILYDEQVMTSKACCFYKILGYFKYIFCLTKTIPQIYKGIF